MSLSQISSPSHHVMCLDWQINAISVIILWRPTSRWHNNTCLLPPPPPSIKYTTSTIHHWKVNFLISTSNDWIYMAGNLCPHATPHHTTFTASQPASTTSSTESGILLNKEYYVNESFSASWHCVLSVPVVFIFIALMGCGGVFIVLHSLFLLLLLLLFWASHPALLNGVNAGTNPPPHMTCEYYEVIGDAGGGGGGYAALSAYTTWRRLHHCWMTLSGSYLVVIQS